MKISIGKTLTILSGFWVYFFQLSKMIFLGLNWLFSLIKANKAQKQVVGIITNLFIYL